MLGVAKVSQLTMVASSSFYWHSLNCSFTIMFIIDSQLKMTEKHGFACMWRELFDTYITCLLAIWADLSIWSIFYSSRVDICIDNWGWLHGREERGENNSGCVSGIFWGMQWHFECMRATLVWQKSSKLICSHKCNKLFTCRKREKSLTCDPKGEYKIKTLSHQYE